MIQNKKTKKKQKTLEPKKSEKETTANQQKHIDK